MGVLATIFGAKDVILRGLDLIDDIHTSDEERLEAGSKAKVNLLAAYEPFKIAQRLLALMFTVTFLFSFFLVLIMTLAGWGNTKDVFEVLEQFYIGPIMMTIVIFYFGGGFAEGAFKAAKAKAE